MGIAFERIIIVMLENSTRANVLANPYMNALRKKGVFLSNSRGVTHSSQPNYIVSVGGDSFGLYDDTPGYVQWIYERGSHPITSIVDLLEPKRLTWRNYAEDLPADYTQQAANNYPSIPQDAATFARKHVPFLSFPNIVTNPERLANIVDGSQFAVDLAAGNLPNYSWYTPNLINDGHNLTEAQQQTDANDANRHVNIENIAAFLENFLGDDPISKFPQETLIVITFDEAYPYHDPYGIYTLLIGDMLQAGTTNTTPCNHYTLLRSVEVNYGLGDLGRNDAVAAPYWFLQQ
jgi:acid phosphatase